MNKYIKVIAIAILSVVMLGAAVYEYDINISEPSFIQKDGFMSIDIPGCMQIGIEGEPLRPHLSISYALPPGETLDKIEYITGDVKTYPLMLPLLPKMADRPLSWGNSEKDITISESAYSQEEYAVKNLKADVQWYKGIAIVMGTIDPSRYFPASGNIEIAGSAKIRIITKSENKTIRLNEDDMDILSDFVQNVDLLSQYNFSNDQSKNLLVITKNEFKSAFDTLKTHYLKFGIKTEIKAVEELLLTGVAGNDLQEKIRNSITEKYLSEGLDFVILGGNSTHVPHRGLSCQVWSGGSWVSSNNIPADLYYAALDGNWDSNQNGIFGEYNDTTGADEADLLPEIAIGRMPVATLGELKNMISKSIRYQSEPIADELNKQVLFGEKLYNNPESWGADYLELLIGRQTENGYDTKGIPAAIEITKWYDQDSTDQWSNETVKNELANGTSFLHHDGHCNYTVMMDFTTSGINDSDFVTVNGIDHTMPIFYSHGCNCGGFDRYNAIASRFVTSPYITVGGVFNSRYGWFNEGQTEGPSIHLHREFENAIYGFGIDHFGWALSVSKLRTAPWVTAPNQHEQNALRWNYYAQNILGDPAMRIYSNTPILPDVSYDISEFESGVIKAFVSHNSNPVDDAGLAIIDENGALIGFGMTDISGYAEVDLSAPISVGDSIHCFVTGFDLIPGDTTIVIIESSIDVPDDFDILSNYPNPFNPSTRISYNVYESDDVIMSIYDIQGKLVKVLLDKWHEAGAYNITLNGTDLSSGEYICSFQIGDKRYNRKLLLLK